MNTRQHFILVRIICSAVLLISGFVLSLFPITAFTSVFFYIASAVVVGYDVILNATNGIIHGHILDENFLMSAGSICAFILGEYAEGTFILLFYQVGELFQSIAVGKSRRSIAELMDIRPDYANLYYDGQIKQVDPYDVNIGDIIVVKPGEKIPLDAVVLEGQSDIDTSSLTGESAPISALVGSEVISGSINLTSPLRLKVLKEFDQSTVSKILELTENASTRKAKTENFVTTFSKYYTPTVVVAALLMAVIPPLLSLGEWSVWLLRAIMFVVISCPCALVVSVPLAFFGALGGASRAGVLVKGSNYLEALAKVDTIVFDKTGTLTKGSFTVTEFHPQEAITKERLLEVAAACEYHSSHPIALSIKKAYGKNIKTEGKYEVILGKGVRITKKDGTLLAGNALFMEENGYDVEKIGAASTVVHIADQEYLGYILISDEIKQGAKQSISELKRLGIKKSVMLTGDRQSVASTVSKELLIDEFKAELLPSDKVDALEYIILSSKEGVAFVGDGVNDAPVLARADVGIAMGALGSDAAIEAADIVIMNDDLALIGKAVRIARRALRISKQNIFFALFVKFSLLILSFIGLSNVWMAVFADVGVLIIAIINSMRTLGK